MNDPVFRAIARIAVVLAFGVIVLGAFVRLSDAGLGCPDWPTCYGKATWPRHDVDVAAANDAFPERPVEHHKAWKEQVHRHFAATLGLLVLVLALRRNWTLPLRRWLLVGAGIVAAAGTFLYIGGQVTLSVAASVLALGIPVALSLWHGREALPAWARFGAFLFALIMFQALLGMWTVTWKLKPVVVMAHLLGGLAVFSMLVWAAARSAAILPAAPATAAKLRPWLWLSIGVLVLQIALGGWTSANYAALACPDFPTCQGAWWPATDFREAFILWRGIGVDYEGGILDATARATIHLSHRIGAVVTTIVLVLLAAALLRERALRVPGVAVLVLLALQVLLGISNVVFGLPLPVATAHNGVAALLLATLVLVASRLTPARGEERAMPGGAGIAR
jgi:cytochrome c oxidase assembly protein subunit 15